MPDMMAEQVLRMNEQLDYEALQAPMSLIMDRSTGPEGYQALASALGDDPEGVKMLTCQLHCACLQYRSYLELGIDEQIFFDTMSCYTRFVTECLYYKGGYQFDRGWWTWRQLSLSVFRLEHLEFELKQDGSVFIHIPSMTDLSAEAVDVSLKAAAAFIRQYFPDYDQSNFCCRSWMLSPTLGELLEPRSRILAFMRRFEIREVDAENQDYVSWLFRRLPGMSVDTFPEDTSLQRNVKAYLRKGGKIGTAFGVLIGRREL